MLTLTTPAILFPTVSLLMVAYTNRYLTLAGRIRTLHDRYSESGDKALVPQIRILRRRVGLIKLTQALGVLALLFCVVCMFLLFRNAILLAEVVFGAGLLLLMGSLVVSLWEVMLSVKALDMELADIVGE
jgi:hypothetical protein